jgi:carboxyl-terminal processing protease
MEESTRIYNSVLSKPFDYAVDESFNIDYEKRLIQNAAELDKWRKQIKLSTLSSLVDKQKLEQDKRKMITYQRSLIML